MVLLEQLTWKEAQEWFRKSSVAIVPVGSTEQHGLHLPLGTDFLLARYISQKVSDRAQVLCTPTIPVGVSPHHRQFWGTLTVPHEVLRDYIVSICLNLKSHGTQKIVVYCCHGGNRPAVADAIERLREEHAVAAFAYSAIGSSLIPFIDQLFEGPGAYRGAHGGPAETALALACFEDLVKKEFIEKSKGPEKWGKNKFGAEITFDTIDFSENGTVGEAAKGTKERGVKLLEAAIDEFVRFIKWLEETPLSQLLPKPHK